MDINSISLSWQTFLAYASSIVAVVTVMVYLRFRVEAVEKNDKRQDVDICELKKNNTTNERNLALILQKTEMIIKQLDDIRDGKH